ncbi:MAG TPA: OmpA family protein [Polyangia bacterium]|nr:OmpA family protein [Polyangia bacterium]
MARLSCRGTRLLTALCLAASATASAQPVQDRSFNPQIFHAAPGPDEFISVEPAAPLQHKGFAFGAYFNYARNEFSILGFDATKGTTSGSRSDLIKAAIGADLWGAFGLWNRFQIALAIPMTLYQTGNDFTDSHLAAPVKAPSGFAFGDPRIHLKVRLWGKDRGIQISLSHWLSIPLGKDDDFGGEKHFGGVAGEGRVLAGWEAERWRAGAFIGVNWRAHTSTFFSTVAGQQLTYGGAFAFDVLVRRLSLVAELYGHSNSFDSVTISNAGSGKISITDVNDAPLELDIAAKFFVIPGLSLNLGVGNGLIAGLGSPQPRVYLGAVYAPDRRDRDHDGVPDSIDKCPDVPEDKDGFQDDDGCPDPDNDNDTILDRDDKCPNQAEDFDQFEDEDGCPDPDNDKDGIDDLHDACPNDPEDHKPPKPDDGCPVSKTDTDGDGIMDSVDKCPTEPEDKDGFQDEDGCPDPDNDNDGIPDGFDNCPMEPEDLDGFQDEDGCPDPDNDHDGILDKDDKCPNEPETINGYQDEDGCPDKGPPSKVKIENGQIVILEKIFFDTDKAKIKPKSFGILDQVAQVIKGHPEFKIRVEGHTDSQGNDAHNTKLSQERADSVRTYLIKKMIAPERLVSVGYGPSAPIADNKTKAGREANRRVEFHIVEEPKTPQKPGDSGDENKSENKE